MKGKWRTVWFFVILMIMLEILLKHVSCREHRGSNLKSEKQDLRSRRVNTETERRRLLRRLLETTYVPKRFRNEGRQRWAFPEDNEKDFHWRKKPFERKPKGRKRFEDQLADTNTSKSCCPQRYEVIEPNFGRNRTGHMVELYKDEKIHQRFYELVCDPKIADEPCRFLEGRNYKLSRCTQQHAYTYALVRSNQSLSGWSLDHIRIRSGCVCKLYQPVRRKKVFDNKSWDY